jgi:hypothetical protein
VSTPGHLITTTPPPPSHSREGPDPFDTSCQATNTHPHPNERQWRCGCRYVKKGFSFLGLTFGTADAYQPQHQHVQCVRTTTTTLQPHTNARRPNWNKGMPLRVVHLPSVEQGAFFYS